jgi:chromosome segregation ATPase
MTVRRLGQQIDALRIHLGELTRLFATTSIEQERLVSDTLDELAVTSEALDMARRELHEHEAELAAAQAALQEREDRVAALEAVLADAERRAVRVRRVAFTATLALGLAAPWLVSERLR